MTRKKIANIFGVALLVMATVVLFDACSDEKINDEVIDPEAPTNLSAAVIEDGVRLSWNTVSPETDDVFAVQYWIMRGDEPLGAVIDITYFIDESPEFGSNSYTVSAQFIDADGVGYVMGPESQPVVVDFIPAPKSVTAVQSCAIIVVSWYAVEGATGGYVIERSGAATGTFTKIGNTDETDFTDDNPLDGSNFYRIFAIHNSLVGVKSSPALVNFTDDNCLPITIPATPVNVRASQNGRIVSVTWDAVAGATGYRVYRGIPSGTFPRIGSSSGMNTHFSDNNPSTGINYYRVTAFNSAGESAQSYTASINYIPPANIPCPVINTLATGNITSVNVSWRASTDIGCGMPTSYEINKLDPISSTWVRQTTISTVSWADSNPHPGINHYIVVAINNSGRNQSAMFSTSSIPLPTPTTNIFNVLSWSPTNQSICIPLVPQKGATHYRVYYSQSATGAYTYLGEVDDSQRISGFVNFNMYFPMSSGSTWFFRVRTVYRVGNTTIQSEQSPSISFTMP